MQWKKLRLIMPYAKGVIIVASAGNRGAAGMGYPGAYAPVISVAASGWIGEWYPGYTSSWWYALNVADPTNPDRFLYHRFLKPSTCRSGSRRSRAWIVDSWPIPGQQRSNILLLSWRHQHGISACRRHRCPDGSKISYADCCTGGIHSGILGSPSSGVADRTIIDPTYGTVTVKLGRRRHRSRPCYSRRSRCCNAVSSAFNRAWERRRFG